jgi:hypothetical protein
MNEINGCKIGKGVFFDVDKRILHFEMIVNNILVIQQSEIHIYLGKKYPIYTN